MTQESFDGELCQAKEPAYDSNLVALRNWRSFWRNSWLRRGYQIFTKLFQRIFTRFVDCLGLQVSFCCKVNLRVCLIWSVHSIVGSQLDETYRAPSSVPHAPISIDINHIPLAVATDKDRLPRPTVSKESGACSATKSITRYRLEVLAEAVERRVLRALPSRLSRINRSLRPVESLCTSHRALYQPQPLRQSHLPAHRKVSKRDGCIVRFPRLTERWVANSRKKITKKKKKINPSNNYRNRSTGRGNCITWC